MSNQSETVSLTKLFDSAHKWSTASPTSHVFQLVPKRPQSEHYTSKPAALTSSTPSSSTSTHASSSNKSASFASSMILHGTRHFDAAGVIRLGEMCGYGDPEATCGLAQKTCRRFLRQACLTGLLREPEPGGVRHTGALELLVRSRYVRGYVAA